ncbi:MAG: NAD(P)/FAD-dependent oxidoreductase [Alphaproteobacteria bacterium]|nr:NAD(P)/FAD-dependent oxidoreductase [Alphaproteobacteria bacterium]
MLECRPRELRMPERYDAIIIGAGHNGLACGAYLSKAGLKVLVLERRPIIGGAAATEEVVPGFRMSLASYLFGMMPRRVIQELDLFNNGLKILPCKGIYHPTDDGGAIVVHDDQAITQKSFARLSKRDAEAYADYNAYMAEASAVVREMMFETPIDPSRRDLKGLKDMASFAWRHRKIGSQFFRLADLFTMSSYDFLSQWFENDSIKCALGYQSSIGTFGSLKNPGSAYVLLHHVLAHDAKVGWGFAEGGMGAISQAIMNVGTKHGMVVRTSAPVARVIVKGGRAVGVATQAGDVYEAKLVASNAHAKTLFERLVGTEYLPAELLKDLARFRVFSTAFKLNIACDRAPVFKAFKAEECGMAYPDFTHLAPDVDYMERAYDDAKYGWYSKRPFMSPVVPTMHDRTLAPPGKHVVNVFGGHTPYELKNGLWANERDNFVKVAMAVMDEHAPGFSSSVIDMQVLLPPDLEEIVGLPGGHIFHGEITPDQLFFKRPAPHYADYRSPVAGLYQCGSSSHPGGGVTGVPGRNAALEILKDWPKLKRMAA